MLKRPFACLVFSFALATSPALARKKPVEPPPCPFIGVLRVADSASIAGLQSLAACADRTIASPATATDYEQQRMKRIVPLRPEGEPRMANYDATPDSAPTAQPDAPTRATPRVIASARPAGAAVVPESLLSLRPVRYTTPHDATIGAVAQRHRIDPLFLHAVIAQESAYRVNATSSAGARGLMQLMPGTARDLGIEAPAIADAATNVDGGARLLRQLYGRYRDFNLTLAAYNAGAGAVQRYGNRIPPYRETQNYVRAVMGRYYRLAADHGLTGN